MKCMQLCLLALGVGCSASAAWAGGSYHRGSACGPVTYVQPRHVVSTYRPCAPVYVRQPVYYRPSACAPRVVRHPGYGARSYGGYQSYQRDWYRGRPAHTMRPGTVVYISGW